MAMYLSGTNLRQIFSFLLGGLGGASWIRLAVAAPLILGSCVVIAIVRGRSTGCSSARRPPANLGIDVRRERRILLGDWPRWRPRPRSRSAGSSGSSDSSCRTSCGCSSGPERAAPARSPRFFGAILLPPRTSSPDMLGDLPVGVVMALIGAPFFLFLLRRTRSGYEL